MSAQTASRHADRSRSLTSARIALAAGAVLAMAAAFGPAWVVRVGVLLAVAAGVVALVLAFRALHEQRRLAGEKLIRQVRAHGAALHAERTRHAEVLTVLSDRLATASRALTDANQALAVATAEAAATQARIAALRSELGRLRGRNTELTAEVDDLHTQLARTQETVASQEAELFLLRAEAAEALQAAEAAGAEIYGIPRRGRDDEAQAASAG